MAYPEGYRKAMRVMELAERHGFPLVTLVDTPGAYPGRRGRAARPGRRDRALAGRHGATRRADRRRASSARAAPAARSRSRSPTGPDAGERDLLGDLARGLRGDPLARRGEKRKAAAAFKPDAAHCLELGVIDGIVPEPDGGAHENHDEAARLLGAAIADALEELDDIPRDELRARRRAKFRAMGVLA